MGLSENNNAELNAGPYCAPILNGGPSTDAGLTE
jgi:hypothetical protein